MSKGEDKKLAALARKNAAKSRPVTKDLSRQYDDTLRIRSQDKDPESGKLFKEMKRREF